MAKMYTVRRRFGGRFIEEVIFADSYEGAQAIAERLGGEVVGALFDEGIEHEQALSDDDYE